VLCQLLSVRGVTRENVTLVDPIHHTDTHIRAEGFEVRNADINRMISKIGLMTRPNTLIVYSGSIPRGMDVSHLNLMVNVSVGAGAEVVLDVAGDLVRQMAFGCDAGLEGGEP
jgi:fructose-1-phosphate kinase PfkB-like protein